MRESEISRTDFRTSSTNRNAIRVNTARISMPFYWIAGSLLVTALLAANGCGRGGPLDSLQGNTASSSSSPASEQDFATQLAKVGNLPANTALPAAGVSAPPDIQAFCSDCHALPQPTSFEQDIWYEEIRQGYEFYARSGRVDLAPPPLESVLRFYRQHAPAKMRFPEPGELDTSWLSKFTTSKLDWKDANYITPAVSSIDWVELMEAGVWHLIVCDMRDGSVSLVNPDPQATTRHVLARLGNPARVSLADFNDDGYQDLIVSDLGSLKPFDHTLGKVVLLQRTVGSEGFEPIVLAEGLGRVADCAVENLRGDEQLDLIVAEFGHRRGGSIRLLTNNSENHSAAGEATGSSAASAVYRFADQVLDIRPGTIRLPVHDWDQDGNLDFAAIISQEYEAIDLFLNRGTKFDAHNIFLGSDLTYGSIGIELADLDGDGDQDILQVNGDCFDNNYANLSHGVGWLENLGNLQFEAHRLIDLPGAYRAVAGDIDGDGDQDVVVVANLPTTVKPLALRQSDPVAILVLEQTQPKQFVSHVLERGTARYPALEVADFNADGKLDFAVGAQLFDSDPPDSPAARLPRLTIWWQK